MSNTTTAQKYIDSYNEETNEIILFDKGKSAAGNDIGLRVYAKPTANFGEMLTAGSLEGAVDALSRGDFNSLGQTVGMGAIDAALSFVPGGNLISGVLKGFLGGGSGSDGLSNLGAAISQGFSQISNQMAAGFSQVSGKIDYLQDSLKDMQANILDATAEQTQVLTDEIEFSREVTLGAISDLKSDIGEILLATEGLDLAVKAETLKLEKSVVLSSENILSRLEQEREEAAAMTSIGSQRVLELRAESQARIEAVWETTYNESAALVTNVRAKALEDTLRFIENVRSSALDSFDSRVQAGILEFLAGSTASSPSTTISLPSSGVSVQKREVTTTEPPEETQEKEQIPKSKFPWLTAIGTTIVAASGAYVAVKRRRRRQ